MLLFWPSGWALAGRRINDNMGGYVVGQLIKKMIKSHVPIENARVLVMGLAFKENCPDLRNTKVVDSINALKDYNIQVDVYDPWVDPASAEHEYGITPIHRPEAGAYDAIVLAVAHQEFQQMGAETLRSFGKERHVLFDLKYVLPKADADLRL